MNDDKKYDDARGIGFPRQEEIPSGEDPRAKSWHHRKKRKKMERDIDEAMLPLAVDDDFRKICHDLDHADDVSFWLKRLLGRTGSPYAAFRRYYDRVAAQLRQRSPEQVYALWREIGIDEASMDFFMQRFKITDSDGHACGWMIPEDSAEVFLRFFYEYWMEDVCEEFGIFMYVLMYALAFPDRLFDVPSVRQQEEVIKELDKRQEFYGRATMGSVIKVILLYRDEKRARKAVFASIWPPENAEIVCDPTWKRRLTAVRQKAAECSLSRIQKDAGT